MQKKLFISDLHLCEERPHTVELFRTFLKHTAATAQQLYILGDLFEYWAGDDAATALQKNVAQWIKALVQQGTEVFFMSGNRDFLIGKRFTRQCGWIPLTDPYVIQYRQHKIVLMHGDMLCTDDVDYQRFRKKYRQPWRIFLFLCLPLAMRLKMIGKYRKLSQGKDMRIMDVNEEAVMCAFQNHQARWIIHGHTHRPHTHEYSLNRQSVTRFVLADWDKQGQALWLDDKGFKTVTVK